MNEYSPHQDEQSLDRDFIGGARITVECTEQGELAFHCDWDKNDNGATCMATILAVLGKENISALIVKNLEESSESPEEIEELEKVIEVFKTVNKISQEARPINGNEVVITPLEVPSYLV